MSFLAFSLWAFFFLVHILVPASNYEETVAAAKMINKLQPVVLTIKSSDGDLIDCVDKKRQPSLDHPLLRNHKIQKVPKLVLKMMKVESKKANQIWQRNGTRCPKDTVPIRRTTVAASDIMRTNSMSKFERKPPSAASHERAIAIYDKPTGVYGAEASINLWQPWVEEGSIEYSAAQLRIAATGTSEHFEVIEVGWHVYPVYYDNENNENRRRTRLFISWTNDSYQRPCYNLDCGGFVLKENGPSLGSAFDLISTYDGPQYAMSASIVKVPESKGWWLVVDGATVGYWPDELFTYLNTKGTSVEWGGEVIHARTTGERRSTEMGSGQFANQGYKKASYFKKLKVHDIDNNPISPSQDDLRKSETKPRCYTIVLDDNIREFGERGFFYGGPGDGPPKL